MKVLFQVALQTEKLSFGFRMPKGSKVLGMYSEDSDIVGPTRLLMLEADPETEEAEIWRFEKVHVGEVIDPTWRYLGMLDSNTALFMRSTPEEVNEPA